MQRVGAERQGEAMNQEHTIIFDDVSICYGSFTAVSHLSFQVKRGEIFGLLGPNGAGKTTSFLSLTRQVTPASGKILLLGKDVSKSFDSLRARFCYVPDADNHFEEFTARQNLQLFADLYQAPRSRIEECLGEVELLREADLPAKSFSRGMKKKLLLAPELLHNPELLFLDEPTANLDVHSTAMIRRLLQRLAKQGTTILLTTHDMPEVEQVCERVAIINRGKLVDLDSPLGFKSRNTERIVDVVLERKGVHETITIHLNRAEERQQLASLLTSEIPVTLHTREFNFHHAFLAITGEEYN
jgi:ABC-2 type transport system ATP-binding protein